MNRYIKILLSLIILLGFSLITLGNNKVYAYSYEDNKKVLILNYDTVPNTGKYESVFFNTADSQLKVYNEDLTYYINNYLDNDTVLLISVYDSDVKLTLGLSYNQYIFNLGTSVHTVVIEQDFYDIRLIFYGYGALAENFLFDIRDFISLDFEMTKISTDSVYNEGFQDGRSIFGKLVNGTWLNANEYGDLRYLDGRNSVPVDELKADIYSFLPGILGVIFMFFFQITSVELLGIKVIEIIGVIVGGAVVFFIFKFFIK